MKVKLSKNEIWIIIIIGIVIMIIPPILTRSVQFGQDAAFVGDTLGGITAPFLGFFGSVLVYLALRAQIEANTKIQEQFEKQNNDQLFFRLIDGLHDKVINYSTTKIEFIHREEIKSYDVLPHIVDELGKELQKECISYGRHLLAKIPEQIDHKYYYDIIDISFVNLELDVKMKLAKSLKEELIDTDYNDRWERIKSELNSNGYENEEQKKILRNIGSVYFYKTPYSMRYDLYSRIAYSLSQRVGGFLEVYYSTLRQLLTFIDGAKDNHFYTTYLNDHFSTYERTLIFYYISDYTRDINFKKLVQKYLTLTSENIHKYSMVDNPLDHEFTAELNNIYTFDISTAN